MFPGVQLTINQHWFRKWLGAEEATSHSLDQWWPSSLTHICGTEGRWVNDWLLVKSCSTWCHPSVTMENDDQHIRLNNGSFYASCMHSANGKNFRCGSWWSCCTKSMDIRTIAAELIGDAMPFKFTDKQCCDVVKHNSADIIILIPPDHGFYQDFPIPPSWCLPVNFSIVALYLSYFALFDSNSTAIYFK